MNEFEEVDILLVEDNPYDAEMTLRTLTRQKLANRVEWVRDGVEALDFLFAQGEYARRAGSSLPKLILLDLKLPKLTGIEVLRKIKEDPATKHIPVVMLTSSAEALDLQESYRYGVNSYIVKPVNFDHFHEEVAKAGFYWMLMNRIPT
jgi:CheY-like chemotaxis protein